MAWISFDEIKKAVSLDMILQHYQVDLRQVSATSVRGKCPLPMHGSDTSRASFTATFSKGVGGAWACQSRSCVAARNGKRGGNALDLVAVMERCSLRDAAAKMQEWFGVQSATAERPKTPAEAEPEQTAKLISKGKPETEEICNKPLAFSLNGIDHAHPYLASRGVTEEIGREFLIGYFSGRGSMSNRIVFPIHNGKGEVVAYAGRAIDNTEPRYKFPAGFHKSLELYNMNRACERAIAVERAQRGVVVVEGFFDCVKVDAAGFACVALMGSAMSKAQEDLIVSKFTAAAILLDGDQAGQEAATDCLQRLGRRMWAWAPKLADGMQPDMLATEELQALLKK